MGAPELLALSLGLSFVVAALGLAGGTIIERLSADPGLRDKAWGAALLLPVLPPVATALLLITPAPLREVVIAPPAAVALAAPAAPAAAPAPLPGPELDWTLVAAVVVAMAILLAVLRIAALMLRARRLSLLIRTGETPDAGTMETVRDAARGLAIAPPPVVISAAAPEALLAGLRPARLVLPVSFTTGDAGVARAVIAHELAHLKRGDHRALWVEELVLAMLAANPLMPLLRLRRAAAREEACDAIALADAGPETRRAYAQTLIEALRNRAGPQTLALTFTGAGRTTAMHRLKAVLTPAAPAGRRARLIAAAAGVALLAATGATTAALAGQREAEVRISDRIDRTDASLSIAPKQEAARPSPQTARPLSQDQQARYRGLSAQGYREVCASTDPLDDGFCAGVMFAQIDKAGVCPSAEATTPGADRGAALAAYVEGGRRVMRRLAARTDEGAHGYAERAMAQAFPCDARPSPVAVRAQAAPANPVVTWMPVEIEGVASKLAPDEQLRVALIGDNHRPVAETVAVDPADGVRIPLTRAEFPGIGEGVRTYRLVADIHGPDGAIRRSSAPALIRLAPGSQGTARNLTATVAFTERQAPGVQTEISVP